MLLLRILMAANITKMSMMGIRSFEDLIFVEFFFNVFWVDRLFAI